MKGFQSKVSSAPLDINRRGCILAPGKHRQQLAARLSAASPAADRLDAPRAPRPAPPVPPPARLFTQPVFHYKLPIIFG